MSKIITCFKTHEDVSNSFRILAKTVSCNCGSEKFELVRNERSDASYQYLVICALCRTHVGKVTWDDKFIELGTN